METVSVFQRNPICPEPKLEAELDTPPSWSSKERPTTMWCATQFSVGSFPAWEISREIARTSWGVGCTQGVLDFRGLFAEDSYEQWMNGDVICDDDHPQMVVVVVV